MSEFRGKLESLSSIKVLVIGVTIGIVGASFAFYAFRPFQKMGVGTGNIEVENLQIISPKVGAGEKTEILAKVTNTGDRAETRTLKLKVDGKVEKSKDVTLASGEANTVSFKIRGEKVGTHTAKIGKLSKNFEVLKHGIFTSQKYGFILKYPSNWTFNEREAPSGLSVTIVENETGGLRPKAQARVLVQKLNQGMPPMENLKKSISTQVENNENLTWISEAEITETEGFQELNLTVKSESVQGDFIIKQRIMRGENNQYSIQGFVNENNYETFGSDLDLIIENFELIGK